MVDKYQIIISIYIRSSSKFSNSYLHISTHPQTYVFLYSDTIRLTIFHSLGMIISNFASFVVWLRRHNVWWISVFWEDVLQGYVRRFLLYSCHTLRRILFWWKERRMNSLSGAEVLEGKFFADNICVNPHTINDCYFHLFTKSCKPNFLCGYLNTEFKKSLTYFQYAFLL